MRSRWGDDDYTNGLQITFDFNETLWWSPFSKHYSDCREPPAFPMAPCRRTTLLVGQNFYTPNDITNPRLRKRKGRTRHGSMLVPQLVWLLRGARGVLNYTWARLRVRFR